MKNPLEKTNKTEKLLYICICSQWIFGEIVTRDVTRTSVLAFVSSVRSPLTSSSLAVILIFETRAGGGWYEQLLATRLVQDEYVCQLLFNYKILDYYGQGLVSCTSTTTGKAWSRVPRLQRAWLGIVYLDYNGHGLVSCSVTVIGEPVNSRGALWRAVTGEPVLSSGALSLDNIPRATLCNAITR